MKIKNERLKKALEELKIARVEEEIIKPVVKAEANFIAKFRTDVGARSEFNGVMHELSIWLYDNVFGFAHPPYVGMLSVCWLERGSPRRYLEVAEEAIKERSAKAAVTLVSKGLILSLLETCPSTAYGTGFPFGCGHKEKVSAMKELAAFLGKKPPTPSETEPSEIHQNFPKLLLKYFEEHELGFSLSQYGSDLQKKKENAA